MHPRSNQSPQDIKYSQVFRGNEVHTVTYGHVQGVVREIQGANGPWYSTVIQRIYYDDQQGKEGRAVTFGIHDLLSVSEIAKECFKWVSARLQLNENERQRHED